MSFRQDNLRLAYQNLRSTRGRSFLTMLGIIIGVAAVILVVSIGQGVKEQIAGQLGRFGKRTITIQAGSASSGDLLTGMSATASTLLTENDLHVVQKVAGVEIAAPISNATGSVAGDHTVNTPFVVATTADFTDIVHQPIQYGGFFDTDSSRNTVVLGEAIAHQLFDDNAPLGQTLTWRGEHFIVAGVFNHFTAPPFSLEANFNNAVFVPYQTAQKLSGSILGMRQIVVKATADADVANTINAVHAALRSAHGGSDDVTVLRADESDAASNRTIHLLTVLISGAAIIALIVGGVGIMDVMLVSVTERMHEIGLRKAIGATNRQIMRQFIAEAFVLSGIGALIGVAVAAAAVGLLRLYSNLQPVLVWQIMIIAPLIAIGIGLFFGSMPALKAARKDPIEALRHE